MAVQEEIKFVSLEQSNSTRHRNIKKPASLPSVSFALWLFSIRPVQNLEEPYEYRYSRMKEPHEYGYSRVEEPHDYGYFRTEEPHRYGYPILERSGGDIQGTHGFQNFGKLRRSCYKYKDKLIIRSRDLAFKAEGNVMIREHITFVIRNIVVPLVLRFVMWQRATWRLFISSSLYLYFGFRSPAF